MASFNPRPAVNAGDRLHNVGSAAEYLRCGQRLIYRLVAERRSSSRMPDAPCASGNPTWTRTSTPARLNPWIRPTAEPDRSGPTLR